MATYTDINLSLKPHPGTGDVLRKTDVEAVKQSMRTILLSDKFFIPFNPDAGGGIRALLFESITPALLPVIKRKIEEQLLTYEPRCVVQDVVVAESGYNALNIEIQFYIRNVLNQSTQTLNIVLERTR